MQRVFAGMWSLGDEDGRDEEIVARAIADGCQSYVLKPQREGGGNNLYEADAVAELKRMTAKQRRAFILMSRIVPPLHACYIVRNDTATLVDAVSELGFFGAMLADSDKESENFNRRCGYLLRTKAARDNDGGVAAGVAVLDSPYLYDQHAEK